MDDKNIGKLQQTEITTEVKRAYLDYAMSVIVSRALPDVKDGLKPVHRRILYSMKEIGLEHPAKHKKSATVVGEVIGKYHPHGDAPIYDAMVRLAQDFSMRYPLVDGQGNFGSVDGDPPAAMRYCTIGQVLALTGNGLMSMDSLSLDKEENIAPIKVLSYNKVTNTASKWFDSGIHPTLKVTTKNGFSIQGTYNHPLLTWVKDNDSSKPSYQWKLLSQLQVGDILVIDKSRDVLWPEEYFSLEPYVPTGLSKKTEKKILPKHLTPALGFILGCLIAEGTLNAKNKLEFCTNDEQWITAFEALWGQTFPDTRLHKFLKLPNSYGKYEYYRLEIHAQYVINFLRNIGLRPTKSPERIIPFSLLQSPKDVVAQFLQGYFEGDGSASYSSKMNELSCCSKSEELMHQLQIVLLRFGIFATKRFDTYRNIHKLYIRGRQNYLLFQQEIDFFSERKRKALSDIIGRTRKDQSAISHVPFVRDYILAQIDQNQPYETVRRFIYKHTFDTHMTMQMYSPQVTAATLISARPEIKALFENHILNDYAFDAVVDVSKENPERVYSIKVDSSCHSFVANGFINHNTEARLSPIASEMLIDLDKETVDTNPNFDATRQEPAYLPAKLPNLLLMGSEGIAVGMATKIPPHNLTEVIDAVNAMIARTKIEKLAAKIKTSDQINDALLAVEADPTTDRGEYGQINSQTVRLTSDITLEELMEHVKGPDFPTAGMIYDIQEIRNMYATGKGRIIMRGKAETEEIGNGKSAIIITELPYQVNKALLVARIADLVKEKKIEGISDLRDESDRHGLRVVIELKRDATPKKVLNNLYKNTSLQTSFPANVVALVDGTPQTLTLKAILEEYVKHRFIVVTRRSEYELKQAKARLHILEGLKIAVDHIDEVIKTIRASADQDEAKKNLMEKFALTEIQATAILDMQLRRLAALERKKIEDEIKALQAVVEYLEDLLAHTDKMLGVVKDELDKLKEKFGDPRRTKVYKGKVDEFSEEDLIPNEPTVITITTTGYIKRQSPNSFHAQNRGGKGIIGMTTKDEDEVMDMKFCSTHDNLLFFTNRGKVYQLKAYEIGESSRTSKGTAIVNLLNIEQGEKIESFLAYAGKTDKKYIFLTTKNGTVKKSAVKEFENIRKSGIVAIKLEAKDELVWCKLTTGEDDIMIVSKEGKAIRFPEADVRPTGRATMGVRGIKIPTSDEVISMDVIAKTDKDAVLITIMENGLGKKTLASEFRGQGRGGVGVKVANVTEKTGKVVVSEILPKDATGVIMTSKKGQIVKLALKDIPKLSRATQGVILMRFSKANDMIASAASITDKDE